LGKRNEHVIVITLENFWMASHSWGQNEICFYSGCGWSLWCSWSRTSGTL